MQVCKTYSNDRDIIVGQADILVDLGIEHEGVGASLSVVGIFRAPANRVMYSALPYPLMTSFPKCREADYCTRCRL